MLYFSKSSLNDSNGAVSTPPFMFILCFFLSFFASKSNLTLSCSSVNFFTFFLRATLGSSSSFFIRKSNFSGSSASSSTSSSLSSSSSSSPSSKHESSESSSSKSSSFLISAFITCGLFVLSFCRNKQMN